MHTNVELCVQVTPVTDSKLILNKRGMGTKTGNDPSWRGVPLSEIYGSSSPWGAPEFPLVSPGHNHVVLYHIPNSGNLAGDRPPKPQIGQDMWDHDYVRMPCSSKSLYPVEKANGDSHLKRRWEIIEQALWKPIRNTEQLANAILSYNTKFKTIWKFRALHKLFNEYLEEEECQFFFDVTLPEMCKLALALPKLIQAPIPLLRQHRNMSISLSQQQISCLLANAFFCTFPRRNTTKKTSEYASYPFINFNSLYETSGSDSVMEKLKCLCHYFRRVCTKVPVGVVTFSRRSVPPRQCPAWPEARRPLAALPVHVDYANNIEEADGLLQLDFANKFLGGGVLGHGCVQEEIRFVVCPELMVSMLFTEVLRHNEALMMIGSERYSKYSGYGSSFHFTGDFIDNTPRDSSNRRRCAVLAIDALPYASITQEYRKEMITRELNKAWVGFSMFGSEQARQFPGVATGNWGCGAFGGSPELKALLQLLAATQAQRPLAYYTFGDADLRDDIVHVYNLLARHNVTVGQLYKYIIRFSTTDVRKNNLHAFIHQALRDDEKLKVEIDSSPVAGASTITYTDEILKDITEKDLSPDLFSQEESQDEGKQTNASKKMKNECESTLQNEIDSVLIDDDNEKDISMEEDGSASKESKHEMAAASKMAAESKMAPQTLRLFDEMEKFDEDNGRLNLSLRKDGDASLKFDTSMECDRIQIDVPSDVKKKIAKKITDFFPMKPK